MFEQLFWTVCSPLFAAEGGWISTNWNNLLAAVNEKRFWDALTNPYIIIISVAIAIFAIVVKSKKLMMVDIAVWGYALVFHFTIEEKKAGDVMFDYNTMKAAEIGPLVWFFAGFIVVTAIILYLGFIKGD